jgi:hypothetical protein
MFETSASVSDITVPHARRATFRATKTLEQFDFERLPKLTAPW